ncbi:SIS domain-containing protein [Nakamurella sp. YIM 132087]|uniref:SIS domain-containing protein n=1 Tax=Nakamurella alba TaxID=2665158 RepID=A0A7K1FHB6_9ACTN|nr:MurR/RpiR family transcriptional regulator [Nakamurella alba]MTD13456.1 SIS domain-containing protein [Nakamurella alba]
MIQDIGNGITAWLGTVEARSGDLAASEAKVVALLLADPFFVGTSTTAQVAARAGVSAPSVVRAARAVGFAGFSELKLEIARARGATEFFAPPGSLAADASTATVLESAVRTGTEALTALGGAVDPAEIEKAVEALCSAGQMLAYGAGPSATVAADAVFRLRALGVRTASIPDHESAMIATRLSGPGDVVIAVSSTGRTTTTVAVADAAVAAGATLIAVTNRDGTPLSALADIVLTVGGPPLSSQMAAAGSRLAHLVTIDCLAAGLALREPDRVRRAERAGLDLPDFT